MVRELSEQEKQYALWLREVNVGDTILEQVGGRNSYVKEVTIENITKTGMFRLSSGSLAEASGRVRGKYFCKIYPITDTYLANKHRTAIMDKVLDIKFKDLTTEQLEKIVSIVENEGK